jgi:hypothetical protein
MPKYPKYLILLIAVALIAVMIAGCTSSTPATVTSTPTPTPEIRYVYVTVTPTSTQEIYKTQPTILRPSYPAKYKVGDIVTSTPAGDFSQDTKDVDGFVILSVSDNGYSIQMVRGHKQTWYFLKTHPEQTNVWASKFDVDFPYWRYNKDPMTIHWSPFAGE